MGAVGFARSLLIKIAAHFSYTPLLGIAIAVSFVRVLFYAALLNVAQFGLMSQLLLVSGLFSLFGNLGTQLVAHRDVPRLLSLGRSREAIAMIVQSAFVTVLTMSLCIPFGWFRFSSFGLTPTEFVVALVHGMAGQIFLTSAIYSKSRLAMMQYARDLFVRSVAMIGGGLLAGYVNGSGVSVILAEAGITLFLIPFIAASFLRASGLRPHDIVLVAKAAGSELPWLASSVLLFGSLVAYTSSNVDRWLAASLLGRIGFGQYSFAWIPLLASQSLQALLNASIFPLLAQYGVEVPPRRGFSLTWKISLSILSMGAVGGVVLWLLTPVLIGHWFPKYAAAIPVLGPLLGAAVLRISDFWSSFLIAAKYEWILLKAQVSSLIVVVLGWVVLTAFWKADVTALSLAWLAFWSAMVAHVVSAILACLVVRGVAANSNGAFSRLARR